MPCIIEQHTSSSCGARWTPRARIDAARASLRTFYPNAERRGPIAAPASGKDGDDDAMVKKKLKKNLSRTGTRPVIGWRERVDLPALGVFGLNAKVDTGAKTSSLHVDEVAALRGSASVARLRVAITYTDERGIERAVRRVVQGAGMRRVKSSTGHAEQRPVIVTTLRLGDEEYPIEITLSDRSDMTFPMLIGRGALRKRFLVDCGRSFLQSKATRASRTRPERTEGEEE